MMNYYKCGSYADDEADTLGVHNHSVPTEENTFYYARQEKALSDAAINPVSVYDTIRDAVLTCARKPT